jgi:hypothetical protein
VLLIDPANIPRPTGVIGSESGEAERSMPDVRRLQMHVRAGERTITR